MSAGTPGFFSSMTTIGRRSAKQEGYGGSFRVWLKTAVVLSSRKGRDVIAGSFLPSAYPLAARASQWEPILATTCPA